MLLVYLQFTYGACRRSRECSFDFDLCGWTQDTTDDFDWTRNSNATSSRGTGPSKDHTDGAVTGHYVFIEASGEYKQFVII